MNKAFVKDDAQPEDDDPADAPEPAIPGGKNYITKPVSYTHLTLPTN